MKASSPQFFNIKESRPKVLLLGNGLFYNECNWSEFIKLCSEDGKAENILLSKDCNDIPYSIKANICCDTQDDIRRKKYYGAFQKLSRKTVDENGVLNELLKIPFDAILTTNYTYQIENALNPSYARLSDERKGEKYSFCTSDKTDSKLLIHTYNEIEARKIWHVHGEERRKSSIVLTHDEYGRLITSIQNYFKEVKNKYNDFSDSLEISSWLDYFIVADIYVLGYGFDFSEFDMWWLLGRRLREKDDTLKGNIVFYEPSISKVNYRNRSKLLALREMKVAIETFDSNATDDTFNFEEFYLKAIADLNEKITKG